MPEQSEEVQRLIALHNATGEDVCLTHNDLSSFNILADNEHITGIVDWEIAAWLPSYWEYTSAWHVNPQNMY
jgi:aminoglycoside phosphotransferase (APT) family kinase protein